MLKLIDADIKYLEQYREAYFESLKQIQLGNIKNHDLMFLNPDEENVIQIFKDSRDVTKLPSYYVPSYDFFAVDEGKFIGIIRIRIKLTDSLMKYGGHIGYAVNPKYWNMGYGKEILRLGLTQYKHLIEEDKILLTCDDDNIASYKIIEANGGILENKIENVVSGERFLTRRYWINK